MRTTRLLRRALRHYATRLLPVVGLLVLLCFTFTALAAGHASSLEAVRESVRLGMGDQAHAVQTREVDDATLETLEQSAMHPIGDATVEMATDAALATVDLRSYDSPDLRLSALLEGRHPDAPGEGTVSSATAEQLALEVGDTVSLPTTSSTVEVVGIGDDPARIDALGAAVLVESVAPGDATVWVSRTDPYEMAALVPLFESEALTIRTVELLADDEAADAGQRSTVSLTAATNVIGAVTVWMLLIALPSLAALVRPSVVGLRAAGVSDLRVRRLLLAGLVSTVAASALLGCIGAMLVMWAARLRLSGLFDERWSTIVVPLVPVATLLGGLAVVVVAAEAVRGWREQRRGAVPFGFRRANRRQVVGAAVVNLALSAAVAASVPLLLRGTLDPEVTLALVLLAVVTAPATASALALLCARRVSHRSVLLTTTPLVLVLSVAVALLAGLASAYSARAVHDDRSSASTGGGAQPPGSLAVYQVPTRLTDDIVAAYADLGGRRSRHWILPNETGTYIRVTQPAVLECMERENIPDPFDALTACSASDGTADDEIADAQIEIVAFDPGASDDLVASSRLTQDGTLGFIEYDDRTGAVARIAQTDDVPTEDWLGGNLPGAVLAVDGEMAGEFSLTPSASSMLYFADFGELAPGVQARFRGLVARLAGSAQIAEDNPQIQSQRTRLAWFVAVAATGLVTTLVLFAGSAISGLTRSASVAIRSVGGTRRQRLRVAALVFGPLVVSGVLASGWGLFVAWMVGVKDGLGFGAPWLLPPLGLLVAVAVVALRWATAPRPAD